MTRTVALIIAVLLALALTAAVAFVFVVHSRAAAGPVYTVTQVQAGLARHPQAWVGRTVLVRGTAFGWVAASGTDGVSALPCFGPCPLSLALQSGFTAPHLVLVQGTVGNSYPDLIGTVGSYRSLTLLLQVPATSPNPLLTFVRGLPVIGSLLPATGRGHAGTLQVYRVRLLPTSPTVARCRLALRACDDALLLTTQL
jgi:hypothetical protein